MWKRALVTGMVLSMLTPLTALANYRDTGFDADDVPTANDLRSTTRKVVTNEHRRVFKVILRAWEEWPDFPSNFFAVIRLDTRGGPETDERIEGSAEGCAYKDRRGYRPMRLVQDGARYACRMPMAWFNDPVTKRIRWKVRTLNLHGEHADYGPNDRGWYS